MWMVDVRLTARGVAALAATTQLQVWKRFRCTKWRELGLVQNSSTQYDPRPQVCH